MATKAKSISISKLSAAAHEAATAALAQAGLKVEVDPGLIYNHPWIIGIVIRNPDTADFAKYQQVAEHITAQISRAALQPLPPNDSTALFVWDSIHILGYWPEEAKAPVSVTE